MTKAIIQRYEVVVVGEVEQRLNNGYSLHGSPVFDSELGKLCQAITMSEPLAVQRLSYKKKAYLCNAPSWYKDC